MNINRKVAQAALLLIAIISPSYSWDNQGSFEIRTSVRISQHKVCSSLIQQDMFFLLIKGCRSQALKVADLHLPSPPGDHRVQGLLREQGVFLWEHQ